MIAAAIIDASVAVKWVVQEADSAHARALFSARLEAPDLWVVECANILWKKVQLGDLSGPEAEARLDLLLQAPVHLTGSSELLGVALRIAMDLKHPANDCVYLALAHRRGVPLVTADRRLVAAVRKRRNWSIRTELLADLG